MTCAPNSDLFGRRWFLIGGNIFVVVGALLAGTAKSFPQFLAGMAISGFGGGNCQMATFAAPELLPNKWRPGAVFLADSLVIIACTIEPVAGRYALEHGTWPWLFYAAVIGNGIGGIILLLFYFPPKHPRGLPFRQALRELDYVGMLLFTAGAVLLLMGVVFASYVHSTDARVVATLVIGFATLAGFACWETWAPLTQPLTPTALFKHNRGRTLTAPFIVTFMVPIYYLGTNIVWSTIVNTVLTTPDSPASLAMELSIIQGLGMITGGALLAFLGAYLKHWKWTQFAATTLMTMFGGLLAMVGPNRRAMLIAFNFLGSVSYAWAQYLSIAYCQFGAPQTELGIAGGLA
jgi:MFS family permease